MFNFVQFILLLHIVTAIMALVGLGGRQLIRSQAAKTTDLHDFHLYSELAGRFENWLAIPGSMLVFLSGILIAWLRGWPLFGFLQGVSLNWVLVSLLLYIAIYPLVIFVFIPRGKVFGAALDDALARGVMTPELRTAFHDPTVRVAHLVEMGLVAAIVYLMVMKPF